MRTVPAPLDKSFKMPPLSTRPRSVKPGFILLADCMVVAALMLAYPIEDSFAFDKNALIGQAPYKTDEEMQAELARIVEEGMFDISIASAIEFTSPTSEGLAYIENVPGNRYDMRVTLVLEDGGDQVYRSGALAPGTYLETIGLNRALSPGRHDALAVFEALDRTSHEQVGTAAAKVVLVIGDG